MNELSPQLIGYALIGSIIPTVLWLWFWSREDRFCPEPKIQIMGAFIFGALAALFTIPSQQFIASIFGQGTIVALILFVTVEEVMKYFMCWYIAMRNNPYYNERIDSVIYLTTTAVGFAMLENLLYFMRYLHDYDIDLATLEGVKRMAGGAILHMVTAGIIGLFIAWAFHSTRITKKFALATGVIAAIAVHVGFNFLVVHQNQDLTLVAFGATWFLFLCILIGVELFRKPICPAAPDWSRIT